MRRYPHLVNRRGHYYFRMAVPVALRGKIGQREIFHSLKTKDYQEAKVRVWGSLIKTQEAFRQLECGESRETTYALYDAPVSLKSAKPQSPLLSAVYAEFLLECQGDREKTINKRKSALSLWLEIVGDMPIADLAKNHSRDFKATLMRLPANRKQKHGNAPISTIDLEAISEGQRLSPATINSQLLWMSGFIGWAINNGYYHAENPFKGLLVKDQVRPETKRHPFTDEQLQLLFSSPVYRGCRSTDVRGRYERGSMVVKDSLYWIPLIALYTGARLQEICQLYTTDIRQEQGVWLFDFNDNGNDKLLKTASSRRKTPIHPKLIDLGLIEYCQKQQQQRLFPDVPIANDGTYSATFSKRFGYLLKRLGVKTDKTSFHSFRHTFVDRLRSVGVQKEIREAIVGHRAINNAHDLYGSSLSIAVLYEEILKINNINYL